MISRALILVLALAGCSERAPDPTLAIAAAVGRAAQSIRVNQHANRWCPSTIDGRELTHSIWRDSDMTEPALVCFYAREGK